MLPLNEFDEENFATVARCRPFPKWPIIAIYSYFFFLFHFFCRRGLTGVNQSTETRQCPYLFLLPFILSYSSINCLIIYRSSIKFKYDHSKDVSRGNFIIINCFSLFLYRSVSLSLPFFIFFSLKCKVTKA